MKYVITVEGIEAAPQGSKRHIGRGIMIESCKRVGSWKDAVRIEANKVVDKLIEEPVHIDLVFWFYRPKSHLNANGEPKQSAPKYPNRRQGDIDKLCRSTLDALTLSAIADDSQVVSLQARKYYCNKKEAIRPHSEITIQILK
ncbi:MAG: hypothetical protein Unbinned1007contig1000_55 [Prokaryotic dsDNA virus sp.]|nr:MAG: hypothetical protein Unbinned1007contig1000_55 [Prokaryotic dsDNA virus sp.]